MFLPGRKPGQERCLNIGLTRPLTRSESVMLDWLIAGPIEIHNLSKESDLQGRVLEVGPRVAIETPASSNIVSICKEIGLPVTRVEENRRLVVPRGSDFKQFALSHHDPLVEDVFEKPLESFRVNLRPEKVRTVLVSKHGKKALIKINKLLGLGWDDWDIEMVYDLIIKVIGRDPTDVELFQLAQMNSEHCRHWFFKGIMCLDGEDMKESLLDLIRRPLQEQIARGKTNSRAAFDDNSSSIEGFTVPTYVPLHPGNLSEIVLRECRTHIIWTAETHCHPTGVSPFWGAATGTGGCIRDVQMMRRGGTPAWTMCGYATGNLNLRNYIIPGESRFALSDRFASPLRIMIEGSNGCARYGNEFGIPCPIGFTRTFGQMVGGKRREYIKPILFAGTGGFMPDTHRTKGKPRKGLLVVSIGGVAYPVGTGGGAASSMAGGDNSVKLDFASVQRGNAAEERMMDEVIYACIMMGKWNPIISAHDQGAGGLCNVITEIVSPAGARLNIRKVTLGDTTMGVLKIWCSEFQERNAVLVTPAGLRILRAICLREGLPIDVLGKVTGKGRIVLEDSHSAVTPVNLPLGPILENVPRKRFVDSTKECKLKPFKIPKGKSLASLLKRVMALPSVGSKNWIIRKKDRSVGGRIARQQGCGPFQLPISNLAAITLSLYTERAAVSAVGEQPIKMLVSTEAGVRMSAAEALMNIMWAPIDGGLSALKCSVNWMCPAKRPGQAVLMYRGVKAISDFFCALRGMQPDGGKDSLSLLAKVGDEEVMSPGTVVVSAYGSTRDARKIITPNIKRSGESLIGFVDLSRGHQRLGGSAIAQTFKQVGNNSPDADIKLLSDGFNAVQSLIRKGLILSGHDRSDGGLITMLAEMAISGPSGMKLRFRPNDADYAAFLFNEELGFAIEYEREHHKEILDVLHEYGLMEHFQEVGCTIKDEKFSIAFGSDGPVVLEEDIKTIRMWWEATSDRMEEEQMNKRLVRQMAKSPHRHEVPQWNLSFTPKAVRRKSVRTSPKVAVIRARGSNGHREMQAAFNYVGFRAYDVTMSDLLRGKANLQEFRGAAFVGGFSYADALGSARGQAALIKFSPLAKAFQRFIGRADTFTFGPCNGCQLGTLLGIAPGLGEEHQPYMDHNVSGKFESGLSNVRIEKTPSIMLRGMEGSTLGVIVSHGEGRFVFPNREALSLIEREQLVALRYTLPNGTPTQEYPFNPNGSPHGIAGITSRDGRHLFVMPHPERLTRDLVWPWMPDSWANFKVSPWAQVFENAKLWT